MPSPTRSLTHSLWEEVLTKNRPEQLFPNFFHSAKVGERSFVGGGVANEIHLRCSHQVIEFTSIFHSPCIVIARGARPLCVAPRYVVKALADLDLVSFVGIQQAPALLMLCAAKCTPRVFSGEPTA
jgi:hypothetical protein